MKNQRANWFISLAITAFLTVGLLSGCKENTSTAPTTIQENLDPSSIDFSHAIEVQNRHTDEMMAIAGVNGTGVGLQGSTPVVYIFTQVENVQNIPAKLEDVPTHIEFIGEVKAMAGKPSTGFRKVYRNPLWSGVSVGNDNECASGTIACVVTDNATHDHYYLLSNNHVFARENVAQIGERIDQPGRYDAIPQCSQTGKVASLSNFVPIVFGGQNNTMDCAIAEISSGIIATSRAAVSSYMPSTTTGAATVGMKIKKTGRTTGLTNAAVSAINVTINVAYDAGTAKFIGQIYSSGTKFTAAGDSGSLWVTDNATATPIGLFFAGSTNSSIAAPINSVLNTLGVSIVNGTPGAP